MSGMEDDDNKILSYRYLKLLSENHSDTLNFSVSRQVELCCVACRETLIPAWVF